MWIARDFNGILNIFKVKPRKNTRIGMWVTDDLEDFDWLCVNGWAFSEVHWSDEEPTEIILKK